MSVKSKNKPIGVFEENGLAGDGIGVGIEFFNGQLELLPVDEDIGIGRHDILLGEVVRQIVEDEEEALVRVGAHENVGFLEVARCQRVQRRFVEEGAIDDGHEGELEDAQRSRFVFDQLGRVVQTQAVERGRQVIAFFGTTNGLGQSQSSRDGLFFVDCGPRRRGRAALHDSLTEQVARERR